MQCVSWFSLCDGVDTCSDKSDENLDFCKEGECFIFF